MILAIAFSKLYDLYIFIIQCLFCPNFSLLCCVHLMLNFIYSMIHMFKAHALLYHKPGEMLLVEDILLCYIIKYTIYVVTVKHNYLLCT